MTIYRVMPRCSNNMKFFLNKDNAIKFAIEDTKNYFLKEKNIILHDTEIETEKSGNFYIGFSEEKSHEIYTHSYVMVCETED